MKRIIFNAAIILLLLIGFSAYYLESNKNETTPEDIMIEAVLKPNHNPRMDYKDIMLEVTVTKNKNSQHMIYPYISGLYYPGIDYMSFDAREEEGFYVPGAIGISPMDDQKVYDTLKQNRIIDSTIKKEQVKYAGFATPQDAGVHKMRIYFNKDDFNANNEMYLVYVHKEEGVIGKDIGWTKLVRVINGVGNNS